MYFLFSDKSFLKIMFHLPFEYYVFLLVLENFFEACTCHSSIWKTLWIFFRGRSYTENCVWPYIEMTREMRAVVVVEPRSQATWWELNLSGLLGGGGAGTGTSWGSGYPVWWELEPQGRWCHAERPSEAERTSCLLPSSHPPASLSLQRVKQPLIQSSIIMQGSESSRKNPNHTLLATFVSFLYFFEQRGFYTGFVFVPKDSSWKASSILNRRNPLARGTTGKDWGLSWQWGSCLLLAMLPGQAPAARRLSLLLSLQPLHQGSSASSGAASPHSGSGSCLVWPPHGHSAQPDSFCLAFCLMLVPEKL